MLKKVDSMESIIKKALENEKMEETATKRQAKKSTSSEESSKKPQKKITKKDDLHKVLERTRAKIAVVGCGGAGNNTITRMSQVGIEGVKLVAINTDAQDLLYTEADEKILIGKDITGGLGAGSNPNVGEAAAKESKDDIKSAIEGYDLVFVTAGLGGGTGTGSAPVVAEIAQKEGALVVGVVTLPFSMEGYHRMENAKKGLEKLRENVDTLIVIPNDKLLELVPNVSIVTAFKIADEILVNAVKGISELITKDALINLDFADVKAVMSDGGYAMIGMGESDTENRASEAVNKALNNPLLDVDIEGAKGALIHVSGGADLSLKEAKEVVYAVTSKLDRAAKVIWGAAVEPELGETLRVMIIVTGVKSSSFFEEVEEREFEAKKEIEEKLGIEFL